MSKESLKRLEEVTRRTFGEPVAHLEDLTRLEAEVERLTAELAAEKIHAVEATAVIIEAQAREKALRKITGQMSSHPRAWDGWSSACAEWDLRAAGIV